MRILITGVSGFVGRRLARYLVAEGDEVTGTFVGDPMDVPCETMEADLLDPPALARAVEAADPDAVIHLAGLSHVGASWQAIPDYFRVNLLGTENLLAVAAGRRVVLASTSEIYGDVPEKEQPIAETRTAAPLNPYALTKAAAERLVLREGGVVVRAFNLVGPGQAGTFAFPCFAAQLAAVRAGAEPVLRVGNLEARRDFLHVDDGVRGYRMVSEKGGAGEIYNLGSGRAISIREGLAILRRIAGVEVEVRTDRERLRPVDVPLQTADWSRIGRLGWAPERSVEDAMSALWESIR